MNDYNEKKEKKGGFGALLSGLLRGGASTAGSGFGSAGGAAGGLGGLFATKAGLVGLVLGGATIAAGVGVIYNFMGPSGKPAYSPELFQNSYYEEEASKAGAERAKARDASAADASTLDMFREQAKKDGIGLDGENADGQAPDAQASADPNASASADVAAPSAPEGGAMGGGAKLQAASGFGSKGGGGAGGGSSIPRMQGGGSGLSGGIGSQFQSVYRPPAQANGGKMSGMTASAARVKSSPKYAVPNFNKKGAFGQAKFANAMGAKARYGSDVGSKSQAGVPFDSSQSVGSGDVGAPNSGVGLGGAGVSSGSKLKGNDPSMSNSEVTPPKVPDPENVSPWKAWTDRAMYAMLAATALILITKILANFAKGMPWMYYAAMATAVAAMAAAALVMISGMVLASKYGQKYTGMMYMVAGGMLMWQAYEALKGVGEAASKNGDQLKGLGEKCPGYDANTAASNFKGTPQEFSKAWEGSSYDRLSSGQTVNTSTGQMMDPGGKVAGTYDATKLYGPLANNTQTVPVTSGDQTIGNMNFSRTTPTGSFHATSYTPSAQTTTGVTANSGLLGGSGNSLFGSIFKWP